MAVCNSLERRGARFPARRACPSRADRYSSWYVGLTKESGAPTVPPWVFWSRVPSSIRLSLFMRVSKCGVADSDPGRDCRGRYQVVRVSAWCQPRRGVGVSFLLLIP